MRKHKWQCSWDARQHQFNFLRKLSWSISSVFQRKFTQSVRRSLKWQKIHLKPIFLGFKVFQGHRCWYPRKARQQCLFMIRSKSVSICNRSHARLVDNSRNRTFSMGYPNLMRSYGELLKPRGSKLALLKSTFNAENFICRLSWSIYPVISTQFTLEMCVAATNREKNP